MTVRATARGSQRGSLNQTTVDVLICGASFGGLAVARELCGHGADVLLIDRYEIGERATSACAAPTPWLEVMGVSAAIVQEIPYMRFTTPHGQVRYRLPWTWSSFDYRRLCELLYAQSDARFQTAKVEGLVPTVGLAGYPAQSLDRRGDQPRFPIASGSTELVGQERIAVSTDRGVIHARIVVDALGWRRVLGVDGYQPPDAPLSRGLEVHPRLGVDDLRLLPLDDLEPAGDSGCPPKPAGDGEDLDVWIERSIVAKGYGWRVPAAAESRIGVGSYEPTDHVRKSTVTLAHRLGVEAVRYQGNWFPHRLREATEGRVFFVGDSAGHCFALSGEGIRTAFYFGVAAGREIAAVIDGRKSRDQALSGYRAFNRRHRRAFAIASALQMVIPRIPPRLLTVMLAAIGRRWIVDRAFCWYLDQAHPSFVEGARPSVAPASPIPA